MPSTVGMLRVAVHASLFMLLVADGSSAGDKAPLGVALVSDYSIPGFPDQWSRINKLYSLGFRVLSLVPTWPYVGLNKIDFTWGPQGSNLADTIGTAFKLNMTVVLKPHLDPPAYNAGWDLMWRDGHSWREACPWRGYFDIDPAAPDYTTGIMGRSFSAIAQAVAKHQKEQPSAPLPPPVRLELGTELMNSIVQFPENWVGLLNWARAERARLGLEDRVQLSYNFEHHIEIPEDVVLRMSPAGRDALADFIGGLDALALSQYMDLSIAQEPAARAARKTPTALDIARSLARHDKNFRTDVLQGLLNMKPEDIPPIHIGEFGVGRGGLRHPNIWDGPTNPEIERELKSQVVRAYEGLALYLGDASIAASEGVPRSETACLWVTGPRFDVWGWEKADHANPPAQAVATKYLREVLAKK